MDTRMKLFTKINIFILLSLANFEIFAQDLSCNGPIPPPSCTVATVPEPSMISILAIGLVGLIATRFIKK